jgi:hypothetical protein
MQETMTAETHKHPANFIWSNCNLLRGQYKRNEYRKVILPLTVLRQDDIEHMLGEGGRRSKFRVLSQLLHEVGQRMARRYRREPTR